VNGLAVTNRLSQSTFVAVSTNAAGVSKFGIDTPTCSASGTGSAALLHGLGHRPGHMLAIGPDNFHAMLSGFHQMDEHFRTTPFEQNLPVLLGLLSVWNTDFLGAPDRGRIALRTIPEALPRLPAAVDHGEQRQARHRDGSQVDYDTGPIYWGEPGTNGQHSLPISSSIREPGSSHATSSDLATRSTRSAAITTCCWPTCLRRVKRSPLARRLSSESRGHTRLACAASRVRRQPPVEHPPRRSAHPRNSRKTHALYEHSVFTQGIVWQINSFDQWAWNSAKCSRSASSRNLKATPIQT